MKKSLIQGIALIFLVTTCFFSCSKGKRKQIDNLKFNQIEINQTAYLLEEEGSPGSNLVINYTYPVAPVGDALVDSINRNLLNVCFGEKYKTLPTEVAIDSFKNEYIRSYKNDLTPLYLEDRAASPEGNTISSWYSYYHTVETKTIKANPLYLSYQVDLHEYTGGAHGSYATFFLNFNPDTGHLLRLKDVFQEGYEEIINEKLLAQLMKDTNTSSFKELQEAGYFLWSEVYPSTNFLLEKNAIKFFYNIYEITPYAMGTTAVNIPYKELKEILKIAY